jgi:hypothetical protein
MKTVEVKLYTIDELSDTAQAKAIEHFRDGQADDTYWHEFVFDDAKEIGALMGITIKDIYFSGFYSQGDGACFEGDYQYKLNSVKLLTEHAPEDTELHRIVKALYELQKRSFYKLTANIKHSGHYYHKYCTNIIVETYEGDPGNIKIEEELTELLRDFMDWIYKQLRTEYEYINEDAQIKETIKINDYQYLENGTMANCLDK